MLCWKLEKRIYYLNLLQPFFPEYMINQDHETATV